MKSSIRLVRIGDWVIPGDTDSYRQLQRLGLTHTRIKRDVYETIYSLKLKPNGVQVTIVEFSEIWADFLGKVARQWKRTPSTSFKNSAREVRLETLHPAVYDEALPQVEKIEQCFDRFFTRWGTSYQFTFSESRGKIRIHIQFKHGAKNPVLEVVRPASPVKVLDFGNTRIELTDDPKSSNLQRLVIMTKAGSEWKVIHTARFLKSQSIVDNDTLAYLISRDALPPRA